ncbi:MAG: Fe-S cluster assembly protein SufD [Planctomycetota bacterium]
MTTTVSPMPKAGPACATDFQGAFATRATQRGTEPSWLAAARTEAMARFEGSGLPSRKSELWRYTALAAFGRQAFGLDAPLDKAENLAEHIAKHSIGDTCARLVFLDGVYLPEFSTKSTDASVLVSALSAAKGEALEGAQRSIASLEGNWERPFLDLNTALADEGAVVRIRAGQEVAHPIQLLFLASGKSPHASLARISVELGKNSRATLVEEYASLGDDSDLVAPVTQVRVADGAELRHMRVQDSARPAFFFGSVDVEIGKDAAWRGVSIQFGAAIGREEVRASYSGSGGEFEFYALGHSDGARVADIQAEVVHGPENCTSRQTYRGVVDDKARGVFNSRVVVERDAQGSDTGQSSKSLLFSDDAIANTKPQLEVLANDVKCFHGATVGQLDEDAFFFLRSRGIGAKEARAMLTQAYALEVIQALSVTELRDRMTIQLQRRLAGAKS